MATTMATGSIEWCNKSRRGEEEDTVMVAEDNQLKAVMAMVDTTVTIKTTATAKMMATAQRVTTTTINNKQQQKKWQRWLLQ